MPQIVLCPTCGRQLRVPDELLSAKVRCPGCATTFTVEEPETSAPAEERGGDALEEPERTATTQSIQAERPEQMPRSGREAEDDEAEDDDYPRTSRRLSPEEREHFAPHHGVLVLVLGVVSVSFGAISLCCFTYMIEVVAIATGIPAWVIGQRDLAQIRAGVMDPTGKGMVQAGYICGIIGTILGAVATLCLLGYIVFFGVMVATGNLK